MTTKSVTIKNRAGIHARPAALIAQTANRFASEIIIEREDTRINAKSIMGIITMAASYNSVLTLCAEGSDEKEAVDALYLLFENKFEED
ncbi:MAG TPA: HPr family phosphocarrier protein [Treponemataceae bacterium]|jgi:phosphocarrier protein|nr:MAG: HPr-like protein Crh [Spirochaetes bacterium ADurb.Bin269]TAH54490.1 MAG: HPr family phosphocarrier protein [Treponema sp.]HOC30028.1 HPr family phosphocarrier protein [Treponemataceae bacterium]HQL32200.1 HPr family phosphocarrier protein [Treponemataceae bacterium]